MKKFFRKIRKFFDKYQFFYWLRTHTINRYHIINLKDKNYGYKWGWLDRDSALLISSFKILCQYVEKEDPFNFIDWDYTEDTKRVKNEIISLYYWWTCERKIEHDKHDADFDEWSNKMRNKECDSKDYIDFITKDEDKLFQKDQEMLHRLIEIRGHLWT